MYGAETESKPMTLSCLTLGDLDNLHSVTGEIGNNYQRKCCVERAATGSIFDEETLEKIRASVKPGESFRIFDQAGYLDDDEEEEFDPALLVGSTGKFDAADAMRLAISGGRKHTVRNLSAKFLPGIDYTNMPEDDGSSLFHRTHTGESCFTKEEAARTCKYLHSIKFVSRVTAALQDTNFELPQEYREIERFFCNETVYGKMNLLWVTGSVRLDPEAVNVVKGVSEVDKILDKWPPADVKAADKKNFENIHARILAKTGRR